jgi:hypothetical protein
VYSPVRPAASRGVGGSGLNPGIGPSPGLDEGGACRNLLDPFGNTLRIDERPGS